MVHVRQHGGLDEETLAFQALATGHHAGAFLAGQVDVLEHALLLLVRHQRVDRCVLVHARTDGQPLHGSRQALDELLVA
ncbi:hypothetical protein FQZ97_1086710 [compost metagenome]